MGLEPGGIGALLLLGDASEVEIRPQTPILQGPDLIEERRDDAASEIADRGFGHCEVLHRDAKENRGSAGVVFADAECDMRDLGPERRLGLIDRLLQRALMYETSRDVRHLAIICRRRQSVVRSFSSIPALERLANDLESGYRTG